METVRQHYDEFLAPVYSWILGDFESAHESNTEYFRSLNLSPANGDLAVDLGSGPGCQSLPLAELGYDVLAVDFCQELLDELAQRRGRLPVTTVCDDVLNFAEHFSQAPDLVVCMGDTLVHLPDRSAVSELLDRVAAAIKPGGTFIYSIRDYVSFEPTGAERFIPLRASEDQIFTCFLDYRDDVVHVHDLLYRRIDGDWNLSISDYLKLRLDTRDLNAQLAGAGLPVTSSQTINGMIHVVATRAA